VSIINIAVVIAKTRQRVAAIAGSPSLIMELARRSPKSLIIVLCTKVKEPVIGVISDMCGMRLAVAIRLLCRIVCAKAKKDVNCVMTRFQQMVCAKRPACPTTALPAQKKAAAFFAMLDTTVTRLIPASRLKANT